jgi:hypothetical protein
MTLTHLTESPTCAGEIIEAKLKALRPTQMTVGMAEVSYKRLQWRHLDERGRRHLLETHSFPAVSGPKDRHYLTDHHHLGLALLREGVDQVRLNLQADFSALPKDEFWMTMDYRQWVHPFDARGRKQPIDELPRSLLDLVDDPFRSLAAAVRMSGGIAKEQSPFAEFLWADFFRHRIRPTLLRKDPDEALGKAMSLVHEKTAAHLPGWSGDRTEREL